MRRCDKHGRYGCADYECLRAETARHSAAWIELRDGGQLPTGSATAVNDTGRDEPALTAEQWAEQHDSGGE